MAGGPHAAEPVPRKAKHTPGVGGGLCFLSCKMGTGTPNGQESQVHSSSHPVGAKDETSAPAQALHSLNPMWVGSQCRL